MASGFDYMGASGKHYPFVLMDTSNTGAFPWHGGVVVMTDYTPDPMWVGPVDNAYAFVRHDPRWGEFKAVYEHPLFYFHPSATQDEREVIVADLVEFYQPPMNDTGTSDQG